MSGYLEEESMDHGTERPKPQEEVPLPFTLNVEYMRSSSSILKMLQVVFSLIAYLCAACAPYWDMNSVRGFHYFEFVCQWHMWASIIFYLIVLLNLHHKLQCGLGWNFTECIFHMIATILFIVAFGISAYYSVHPSISAAAAFAFFSSLVYLAGFWVSCRAWKKGKRGDSTGV